MHDQTAGERRAMPRRKALMTGTIRFRTRTGTLSCVVRNLSTTGAKLAMTGSMWILESFELEIAHQDIRIDARPVWRGETEVGIEFISKRDEQGRSPDFVRKASAEEKVISLEAERAELKRRMRQLTEEF